MHTGYLLNLFFESDNNYYVNLRNQTSLGNGPA